MNDIKLPFEVLRVPGRTVLAKIAQLEQEARGYPVLLGNPEDFERFRENFSYQSQTSEQLISVAESIDPEVWLKKRADSDPDYYELTRDDWPDEAIPNNRISAHLSHATRAPQEVSIIGLLATTESWKAPSILKFGGWNECPFPQEHSAIHKYWGEKYGAKVVSVTNDVIELRVARPPTTREDALNLARQQFIYCSDIVHQGVGSVDALAATVLDASVWFFWWD